MRALRSHHCTSNSLINFYCVAERGSCAGYQCFKYDSRTNTTSEITDGSFACDACSEGYCNEPVYCTTCPDPIVDPQGHDLGPRDPYCNPPVYSPGSTMDQLCGNNQRPLPPPHAIRLTCDAAYDANGCHNYCVFESGLGGGAQRYCAQLPGVTDACVVGQPGHAIRAAATARAIA